MTKIAEARELLCKEDVTLVSLKDDTIYMSNLKGIAPILNKVSDNPQFFSGASVADKVIGRAAALLLVYSNAGEIYADVMSEHAKEILEKYGIPFTFGTLVPYISNRKGDGMCPMEQCVLKESDPKTACEMLKAKLEEIKGTSK